MTMPLIDRGSERMLTSRGNRGAISSSDVSSLKLLSTQARARFDLLTRDMRAAHPEEWMQKHEGTGRDACVDNDGPSGK